MFSYALKRSNVYAFLAVDSATLVAAPLSVSKLSRGVFMASKYTTEPPVISKSEFVPPNMVNHLMRQKKDSALAVKYSRGDAITNMEGALHTFVTPLCKILMTGDYKYEYGHNAVGFNSPGDARPCIMSAAIQPDFEKQCVMLELVKCQDNAVSGVDLGEQWDIPTAQNKNDAKTRIHYEQSLLKHMIYHLTRDHQRPSSSKGAKTHVHSYDDGMDMLARLVKDRERESSNDVGEALRGHIVRCNSYPLSMEMLFNVYIHQLRNELSVLESSCTQGYVYTIDPPAIFAQVLGTRGTGAALLNRFQALAFCALSDANDLQHLHTVGFNDYLDKHTISLLQRALRGRNPHIQVVSKASLFSGDQGRYSGPAGCTLVLHNNSDGFGQNIQTEGLSSMDGVLGSCSDAAVVLRRERADLIKHVE